MMFLVMVIVMATVIVASVVEAMNVGSLSLEAYCHGLR